MTTGTEHGGGVLTQLVEQSLNGQKLANFFLHDARQGIATQDALFDRIRLLIGSGEAERLRSFARVIQKHIERA